MTKSTYPYPPDEFDVAVPGGAPVGVHRAPRSGWSSVWPFLLVAVICAGVAWGGITLLNGDPGAAEADTPPAASASADPSASASAPADPSASASPPPPAAPVVDVAALIAAADTTASVTVYNIGGIQGLAGSAAETLAGQTFANAEAETGFPGSLSADDYQANTVLYGEGRAETAKAIAAVLGIPETQVMESAEVTASPQAVWVAMRTEPTPAG